MMPDPQKAQQADGLYGCPGCGDITTGARSEHDGTVYACCPCCIERATEAGHHFADIEDDDPGPWEDRHPFPDCPECGSGDVATGFENGTELCCADCDHTWTPAGIYRDTKGTP